MPHLESRLQECEGSQFFAIIDFCHGYWQLELSKSSQEIMSIQTPMGVYSPTRILQGGTDSGNHFQAVTQQALEGILEGFLQWLDDFLIYAKSEEDLLDRIEKFFEVCKNIGFKIHAGKTNLFLRKAKFCGRVISKDGVKHEPRQHKALLEMRRPENGADLQQLLCATNWMRTSFPAYAETIAPLHDLLEDFYKQAGKRTRRSVRKFPLDSSWGAIHDRSFENVKRQLAASTELAHPKPDHNLCLFTDASDTHWAAILTQVPSGQERNPLEDQQHEPLCFLSGAFKGSAANWSVPEKEGFAVVEAMCRLDYLIAGRSVSIFTDHANLVYIYDPYGSNPGIARHTANKLMRWALKLGEFRYTIEFLPGEKNVWADMLTRWAASPNHIVSNSKVVALKSLLLAPISPGLEEGLDWPSMQDIRKSQETSKENAPQRFVSSNQGLVDKNGVHWIPYEDELLKLRIMIAGHSGICGYRGRSTTKAIIHAHFWWTNMETDVSNFVSSCIHCLCTETGETVPRPLGHALHATRPNELLHFDFCYLMNGEEDKTYVFVQKDDLSGYVWLSPCTAADAEAAAENLLRCFSVFGVVHRWVSDRGPHFRNEVIKNIRESTKSDHHFTLAYCPWSNGTVEVVCRELLKSTRALLSEFQLSPRSWPSVIPLVQAALNNSPLPRLGNRCPLTVMTGLRQDSPLLSIKQKEVKESLVQSIEEVRLKQVINLPNIRDALDCIHKDVKDRSDKKRKTAIDAHNRRTGVRPINFGEGDFVLKGRLNRHQGRKPCLKWTGPYRVIGYMSDYIFEVEDILSKKSEELHGRRLKCFRNKSFQVTEEVRNHLSYQRDELLVVKEFEDIRNNDGSIEILFHWRGFPAEEAEWTSLEALQEDVPVLIKEYLEKIEKEGTARQRQVASKV